MLQMNNLKQVKAIEFKNKQKLRLLFPDLTEEPAIYVMVRYEDGFRWAYIGQSLNCLNRMCQHMVGYQHIDLSIKKHGFYSKDNPNGWFITQFPCAICDLDEMEKYYIKKYANLGYQLRNKTIGGQGKGKNGLNEGKAPKGYRDGIQQGYKNAQKYVAKLFEKNLTYSINGDYNKNKEKALEKFKDFININNDIEDDEGDI